MLAERLLSAPLVKPIFQYVAFLNIELEHRIIKS